MGRMRANFLGAVAECKRELVLGTRSFWLGKRQCQGKAARPPARPLNPGSCLGKESPGQSSIR